MWPSEIENHNNRACIGRKMNVKKNKTTQLLSTDTQQFVQTYTYELHNSFVHSFFHMTLGL
jgi:hypothetical protein